MNESTYLYKDIINTAYNKFITKIKKKLLKIENKNNMMYNLTAILNFINKLNNYKL